MKTVQPSTLQSKTYAQLCCAKWALFEHRKRFHGQTFRSIMEASPAARSKAAGVTDEDGRPACWAPEVDAAACEKYRKFTGLLGNKPPAQYKPLPPGHPLAGSPLAVMLAKDDPATAYVDVLASDLRAGDITLEKALDEVAAMRCKLTFGAPAGAIPVTQDKDEAPTPEEVPERLRRRAEYEAAEEAEHTALFPSGYWDDDDGEPPPADPDPEPADPGGDSTPPGAPADAGQGEATADYDAGTIAKIGGEVDRAAKDPRYPREKLIKLRDDLVGALQFVEAQTSGEKVERHAVVPPDRDAGWREFPLGGLPAVVADFIRVAAISHSVDHAAVALPLLATASAALGNAWRLKLKDGYLVPPTLWTILVALSGANKSGPLDLVTAPMWTMPPHPEDEQSLSAGQQGQYVIDDATVEAVICRLAECPRGLLLAAPELGQWAQSFNAYRSKGRGGDEQVWIRLWDTKQYRLDRKTNDERRVLQAPAVAIAGAIQPAILEKAADAESLASGLFARALLAMPPDRLRRWEADGVSTEWAQFWADTVNAMRTRTFAAFNPNTGIYEPHVIGLSPEAAVIWLACFEAVAARVHAACGVERVLAAKSDHMAARLALVLYGLECAVGSHQWGAPLPARVMQAGVQAAQWFLDESLRVFEATCRTARDESRDRLARVITGDRHGGSITVRDLQRSSDRYNGAGGADRARADLHDLAASGRGTFKDDRFTMAVA